jgi:predicted nucleotide-binding protein
MLRMDAQTVDAELARYEAALEEQILSRFTRNRDGIHIARSDDPMFRQYVNELVDLFYEIDGPTNRYSRQIAQEANDGVSNFIGSPSYKSVENILSIVRAARTHLARKSIGKLERDLSRDAPVAENVFIIHGRDEAKWLELKDIIVSEFRLNPVVLQEKPDGGCNTVVEKFERYARTCSYAIAVFTPDDEVTSASTTYLQARPNVIYELGWFCGRRGRSNVMLLLKEGTTLFSDFGGIVQKRFVQNVSEKTSEIRKDLIAAAVIKS